MALNLISIQNILKLHYNFIDLNYFHLKIEFNNTQIK